MLDNEPGATNETVVGETLAQPAVTAISMDFEEWWEDHEDQRKAAGLDQLDRVDPFFRKLAQVTWDAAQLAVYHKIYPANQED